MKNKFQNKQRKRCLTVLGVVFLFLGFLIFFYPINNIANDGIWSGPNNPIGVLLSTGNYRNTGPYFILFSIPVFLVAFLIKC